MRPAEGSLIIKDNVKGQLISKGLLESSFQPKNQQKNLRISALASKGQIILKCLFDVFNFVQKMNKN